MPSADTLVLALLILAVLVVELVILWLLTRRNTASVVTIPASDPYPAVPEPREPFAPLPPLAQQRYHDGQQRRRAAPGTRQLTESAWYGGAAWGDGNGDDQWPRA